MTELYKNWVEVLFIIFLVIGFAISITAPSAAVNYFVIFIFGLMSGRLWYKGRKNIKLPTIIVIIGLVLGYILGSIKGDNKVIIILFIVGNILSYYLHSEGLIK